MTFDSMDSFESLDDITGRFASQGLDIEGNVQDCTTCGRQLGTDPAIWVRIIGLVHDTAKCDPTR